MSNVLRSFYRFPFGKYNHNREKWKHLKTSLDELHNSLKEIMDKTNEEEVFRIAANSYNDFSWIIQNCEYVEDGSEIIEEQRDDWIEVAEILADIVNNLAYHFVIDDKNYDECHSWCIENLKDRYCYNMISDNKWLFAIVDKNDAAAFKLRWT